jgi:hypothetical protein
MGGCLEALKPEILFSRLRSRRAKCTSGVTYGRDHRSNRLPEFDVHIIGVPPLYIGIEGGPDLTLLQPATYVRGEVPGGERIARYGEKIIFFPSILQKM